VERILPRLDCGVAIGSHTIAVPARKVRFRGAELFNLYSTMAVHNLSRADIVVSETILVEALWLYCVRSGHRCIDRK